MLISNIKSDSTFENLLNFIIRKHNLEYSLRTHCYGNTIYPREPKIVFLMFHGLILKATKFQLPTLKSFSKVVKNVGGRKILRAHLKALN